MSKFAAISDNCASKSYKEIFSIIDARTVEAINYTADGKAVPAPAVFSGTEVERIKELQFDIVQANHDGRFITLDDVRRQVTLDTQRAVRAIQQDGFYNPGSNIGTEVDVGNWGQVYEPLLIGPYEASAMYSSGGLTQIVIDKKSKGLTISGYEFTSGDFDGAQLMELRDYAESLGFATNIGYAARDALLFGGSVLYPILRGDNPITTVMNEKLLLGSGLIGKDCLDYFVEADRWNVTAVPDFNISARDYLNPRTFYVPISGIEVNAERASYVRTKPLPYWSAIRQLGWGASDITGWVKSLMGYEIMAMSLPIMCQQMSLLVHTLPLDGIIAQNGVRAAKAWQKENEKEMRDWSILNPKAINSYGEINVVNRTYTGFDSLIDAIRKDIAAKTGLPESVLFYSQPNGIFNKNEDDVMLKQSETIKLVQQTIAPAIQRQIPYLAASYFGCKGMDDWNRYKSIRISFDTPVVTNPQKKADVALKMAQAIQLLYVTGFDATSAVSIVSKIIGENEMPTDLSGIFANSTNDPNQKKRLEVQGGGKDVDKNKSGVPQDKDRQGGGA